MVAVMNQLFVDPFKITTIPVEDTFRFSVRGLDSLIASFARIESVQIVGNRVNVVRELHPKLDNTVLLGEKLRFIGDVEGRDSGYSHFLFKWGNEKISGGPPLPYLEHPLLSSGFPPEFEYAGFRPCPGDSNKIAFSGLIFYPQTFYFAVEDTTALGCFSMDSVVIRIVPLQGNPKFDFGEIPGVFTPHVRDGRNDYFMRNKNVNEITILNRWGAIIHQATGENAKKGWDGRDSRTNRMVDRGDYFYIITIYENITVTGGDQNINSVKKHTKTGVVTVL
jgi:gliding motility-associated-like protein